MTTLASRRYTRANPDPNPPPVFENPNLIPRIVRRQEGSPSPTPIFRSHTWPSECFFVEEISFDENFELSLFRSKSETALEDMVLDPELLVDIEVQRANFSIDDYILNSPQSITATYIPEPSESSGVAFHPPDPSAFPSINFQFSSPPSTPTSNSSITNAVVNPPRNMAAQYAPLVLPQVLNDMPICYQSKISIFDATQGITT